MLRRHFAALLACVTLSVGFLGAAAARADGLIVVSNPPVTVQGHFSFAPLQVVYHKVETKISDQMAETSVDQAFYNPNSQNLEGDYIFPVPAGAQINKFTMDIDGKQVAAELLPADKARTIYNDIVRKAKDPALLEYAGRDMFRVHIFPIEGNKQKRITLKYTELLKMDNGLMDYHYTLNTEKYSSKPLENLSIKVTVNASEPITTLYSPTHTIDKVTNADGKSAVVGFEGKNIRPDTDFHLFIGQKASPVGISVLSYRPDPAKEGYFVLLASPTVSKDVKAMPKDVVFVMDTSGSMSGDKIEQARKALKYCVDTLNPQDHFDVVRFSTEAEPLFGGLKDANPDNRKKAVDFAAGLTAAGGTALDEALLKALAEASPAGAAAGGSTVRMVVFMTDGQPTVGEQDPERILAHSNAKTAGVRLFTFGVGTDVNTKLLDLMSSTSRGYSQYVLPNENLELSMSSFWGKVQDPILAGLKYDTGSVTPSKVYPKEMPDLFKGDQLVIFGTYDKPGKTAITLTGMVNGAAQKFTQDVTFQEKTDSNMEWIAKLWATRRVGYLLDEIRLHGESKELKDEVVALARQWGVVTPYTAMLIIEDERARGVPLAERSLREMEYDPQVAVNVAGATDSLRHGEVAGSSQAVANGINTAALKNADSLDSAHSVAAQDGRLQVANGGNGSAMTKNGAGNVTLAPADSFVGGPLAVAPAQPNYTIIGGGGVGAGSGAAGGFGGGGSGGGGPVRGGAGGRGGGRGAGAGGGAGGGAGFGAPGARAAAPGTPANGPVAVSGGTTIVSGALTTSSGGVVVLNGNISGPALAAASAPAVRQSELNLGGNTATGWQATGLDKDGKPAEGYRVVSNYAQQTRVVNNRSFFLNGNQWTDAGVQNAAKDAKHVKIVFGSDAYFEFITQHADATQYLALGNNVTIELAGTIYDIVEEAAAPQPK